MTTPGGALPPDPALDRLLVEAFQRIRLNNFAEAEAKLAEAKAMAPDHPAVLETEGDLAFARRRIREAEELFRRAHALDPGNARIEEKFALAVLKLHEPELLAHDIPDDDDVEFVLGNRKARPPWASALLSVVCPGAGQVFNGDTVKGWALFFAGIYLWSSIASAWQGARNGVPFLTGLFKQTWSYYNRDSQYVPVDGAFGGLLTVLHVIFIIACVAAWLYSIADAFLVANSLTEANNQRAATQRMEEIMAKRRTTRK
jgi:hypothetical protein